jgi:outer membrane protein OmpA-like peptidoglycan-associated protein
MKTSKLQAGVPIILAVSALALVWASDPMAGEIPKETAGDIVNAILPNADDLTPNAAAGGDRAGCGDGEASFFNNEDTCASMGARPTVPVMSDQACDQVVAQARAIDRPVQFGLDKSTIEGDYARYLRDSVAVALNDQRLRPCLRFVIEGHTDASGPEDYNLALSDKRASAVVDFLADHGVDRSRLQSIGYGESRLANLNDPNAAENRRVTFRPEPLTAN